MGLALRSLSLRTSLLRYAPLIAATGALAWLTLDQLLWQTEGTPVVPLDDAYIHFQYARAFARFEPFVYTPGAEPAAGTTSLLWPLLLAPFQALGFGGARIIWVAWLFAWTSFAFLAYETGKLAQGLVEPPLSVGATLMALAFGGFTWFAASGMEVLPLAWLLTRTARRGSEWVESAAARRRDALELALLGMLGPLTRPEGILGSALAMVALLLGARGYRRWAILPALSPLVPLLIYFIGTGDPVATTTAAKWLPVNPYFSGSALYGAVFDNVELLFGTLLDGRLWSSVFLPPGGRLIAILALAALPVAGFRRRRTVRALFTVALALGMLIPTTYETFLVNRLRYLWPFAAGWLVGLAVLSDLVGELLSRFRAELGSMRLLLAGAFVGLLASQLPSTIDDVAVSADAIRRQQVSLGNWVAETLPETSSVGVNDTGAIAYFGGRRTFDIVGLTTRGESKHWVAGPGSRFEHYEKLPPASRPTHFIVYPEWFSVPPLLGEELTARSVSATILGGTRMSAHRARYEPLGSGEQPLDPELAARRRIDSLDVADLDSEEMHGYELFDATRERNAVEEYEGRADGVRLARKSDRFMMELKPGGRFVARLGARQGGRVDVLVNARVLRSMTLGALPWQELTIELPRDLPPGPHRVEVAARGAPFSSLHYWSYE